MDLGHRGQVEGSAGRDSESIDLPASPERVGKGRDLAQYPANFHLKAGRPRGLGLARIIYRRQFCPGRKGGDCVWLTRRGKGTKWMAMVDGKGVPLGGAITSASPAEVRLAEDTPAQVKVPRLGPGRPRQRPGYLIAGKGYDSDHLRHRLQDRGINLIAPYRRDRKKKPGPKSRLLKKYRHRRIVERSFSWIGDFRRLTVGYERIAAVHRAFFHIACRMISLRQF